MSEEQKKLPEPTLTQFIESNHKLISTLAILATLSAFANNFPDKDAGRFLAFCLFTLALLVGIEIVGNFRLVNRGKLDWFQEIFLISMFMFVYVWVRTYYPILIPLLFIALELFILGSILGLCGMAIRRTVSKISWLKNKSQRTREQIIPLFGAMLLMTLAAVILPHLKLIWTMWQIFSKRFF